MGLHAQTYYLYGTKTCRNWWCYIIALPRQLISISLSPHLLICSSLFLSHQKPKASDGSFLLISISLASVCSVTSGYLAKWPKYPFLLDLVNRNFSVWWGVFWSRELLEGKYLGGGCSHFQDVVCIIVSIVYCLNFEGPALVVWAF